jgi:hypothetical protein
MLEFHRSGPADVDKKGPPSIGQGDLCLVFNGLEPEQKHMLAVCDSSVEHLLVVKFVLRDAATLDERNKNLYTMLVKDSKWQILRLCSLENFNKACIGVLAIDQCPLREALLDLTVPVEGDYFPHQADTKLLSDAQQKALKACMKQKGVTAIHGPFGSGKSLLVQNVLQSILQVN